MELDYHLVDVFTSNALEGNALAVFSDGSGLDAQTMQRIAREMNLSETTFILPNEVRDGATRVRIFTPTYEMDFAGHPTIGTAYVMRRIGMVAADATSFELDENIGRILVRVDPGDDTLIWLTTPPIGQLATFPRKQCADALSLSEDDLIPDLPCELLTAGNPNIFVAVRNAAAVDRAELNVPLYLDMVKERPGATCIFVFAPASNGAYSRMFAPQLGIIEDPATGSATGPLAAYMMRHGLAGGVDGTTFTSEQGTKMGRRSILHVRIRGDQGRAGIDVGGHVAPVARGTMHLALPSETLV